ncbi:hypothetical protein [Azospirillum sp.]|uniref:hypothetical protein n=1 Tax=Azospirillum sp. TaxID=34012 RepID=UPI003D70C294
METRALLIQSEDEAWNVLERIAANALDPADYPGGIHFSDWSCELMRIPHDPVHSSITTPMMRVFLDYQAQINKTFRTARYGAGSGKKLTIEEKFEINLRIIVSSGSSVYNAKPRELLEKLASEAVAKMESRDVAKVIVICALIAAVGYFGHSAFEAYWKAQADAKKAEIAADERVKLSEQETKRAELLARLAMQNEQAREVVQQTETAHRVLLKGAVVAGGALVHAVNVPAEAAASVLAQPRRSGAGSPLDGDYEVEKIAAAVDGAFAVQVKAAQSGAVVNAEVRELFVPKDQIDLLFGSLRDGHRVFIRMNTWKVGEQVTNAAIVRVEPCASE